MVCFGSCTHQPEYPLTLPDDSQYPPQIKEIMVGKCATAGCHNAKSFENAGRLNLATWEDAFRGSGTGAVIIPYRSDFSPLCYFTNADTSLGIALKPTMPVGQPSLSRSDYLALKGWIDAGAPNSQGRVKFADDPLREKYYIANRMCGVVTVIDAAAMVQMRQVSVGEAGREKFPYCVKVAPDGKRWYVSFFSPTDYVQVFSAADDRYQKDLYLGTGMWTSFTLTADSRHGWFVDNSNPGKLVYADLERGIALAAYTFGGQLQYPIGVAVDDELGKLYIGSQQGNAVYKVDISNPMAATMTTLPISSGLGQQQALHPTELLESTATHTCFVACQGSKEVRALDMRGDTLLWVVGLPSPPAYMAYDTARGLLFITCPDDMTSFAGNRGSVQVIDVRTHKIRTALNTGYQPYGLALHPGTQMVVVANANISPAGPASHHETGCGKKNGNATFIDLATLSVVPKKKLELSSFPYAVGAR